MSPVPRPNAPKARAAKEVRREQLIKSTIDSIAKRGFADTTLANVADGAGLSRGIVNFHFRSKEALLVATLEHLADEYRTAWLGALERAGAQPAERITALVRTDFDPALCTRKKLAVWYAFWGESRSRPTYLHICGERDREHFEVLLGLCQALIEQGGYRGLQARQVASGLTSMSDGLWLALLIHWGQFERREALDTCFAYLASLFPRHFTRSAATAPAPS